MFGRLQAFVALTTVLAAGAATFLSGADRSGAAVGVTASALGSGIAFAFMRKAFDKGVKQALAAQMVGLLVRMVLVGVGLGVAMHAGANLFWFCGAFFGLFFTHQTLEIGLLMRSARSQPLESKQ